MLTRRILLGGLITAPSIVRASSLMPIKPVIEVRHLIDLEVVDFDWLNPKPIMKFAYYPDARVWKPINDAAKAFWAGEWVKGKNHIDLNGRRYYFERGESSARVKTGEG